MYNDVVRLNIEPKTQRHYSSNNNASGNFHNGFQGSGRHSNYQGRSSGRGANRTAYRSNGSNQRRTGGQFNNNNAPLSSGGDENYNEYRTSKFQKQVQQQ